MISRRSLPLAAAAIAAAAIAAVLAAPLSAQKGIHGRVLDNETGEPIPAAEVVLVDQDDDVAARTRTDSTGAFTVQVRRADLYRLRAQRTGYHAVTTQPIAATADDAVELELRMSSQAAVLAPLTVVASSAPVWRDPRMDGFERRRKAGWGRYLGPEDLRRMNIIHTSEALQRIPGVRVRGGGFNRLVLLSNRRGGDCLPNVYVNGVRRRLSAGYGIDEMVAASQIKAVEVYPSPVTAPGEFGAVENTGCGVIVIWTR